MGKDIEKSQKGKVEEELKAPDAIYGARHTQVLLLFMLIAVGAGIKVNMSVAIVAMTDPEASPNPDIPTYDWNNTSTILSSFFWGYIIPQVMVGWLAKKYGARWIVMSSITVCSIFTLFTPLLAAKAGSLGVMATRILQGFTQGFIFPSTHVLLSNWAPKPERSTMGAFVYTGSAVGIVVVMALTGWICATSAGWPCVFYIYGAVGLLWVFVYFFLGANDPATHKTISAEERYYIEKSLGNEDERPTGEIPLRHILTSMPVWALVVAHIGQCWCSWTLLTETPTYINYVMKFDIESNGLLSAAPHISPIFLGLIFGWITDKLTARKILTLTVARKVMNSIGSFFPAIVLAILAFTKEDQKGLAIGMLMAASAFGAGLLSGFFVNHIDLSPNHSGLLMGFTNCVANVGSILAPLSVQFIVTDNEDVTQWRVVFLIAAGFYVVTNIFYVIFASGERQYWDSFNNTDSSAAKKAESQKKQRNSQA